MNSETNNNANSSTINTVNTTTATTSPKQIYECDLCHKVYVKWAYFHRHRSEQLCQKKKTPTRQFDPAFQSSPRQGSVLIENGDSNSTASVLSSVSRVSTVNVRSFSRDQIKINVLTYFMKSRPQLGPIENWGEYANEITDFIFENKGGAKNE